MEDALLFIQNGWKNLWKQKTIWLFSLLSLFSIVYSHDPDMEILYLLIWELFGLFAILCSITGTIAVSYDAY